MRAVAVLSCFIGFCDRGPRACDDRSTGCQLVFDVFDVYKYAVRVLMVSAVEKRLEIPQYHFIPTAIAFHQHRPPCSCLPTRAHEPPLGGPNHGGGGGAANDGPTMGGPNIMPASATPGN